MQTIHSRRPSLLFAEDFGSPASRSPPGRAAEPPAPPPPSREEIEAQLAESYSHGLSAGIARATADQAEMGRRLIGSIAAGIEAARAEALAAADAASEEIARLLVVCLTTAFPALAEKLGPPAAACFAREVVQPLYGVPRITLRCSPHALAAMERELAGLDEDIRAAIEITPTDAMMPGDVRISWGVAVAQRDSRALWRRMQDALAQTGVIDLADIQEPS
jgi:flagellar biosynthesis/type III secretory pathway protein FliH